MPTSERSLSERAAFSYKQLSTVASDLNTVSDDLGKMITELDLALKTLNLGISVWVTLSTDRSEDGEYYHEELGYAKIGAKWGIALRTIEGSDGWPEATIEKWLFNEAPRELRIAAIGKIPELFEQLSTEARETAEKIAKKLKKTQELVTAVKDAAGANSTKVIPRVRLAVQEKGQ
jgi:hypothetical protein